MSLPNFPTLTHKPDSNKYRMVKEDPTIRNEMEGGYVTSRPRFTRKPRRTFTIGYTDLPLTEYTKLDNFWDTVKGGSRKFRWLNQLTGETITVRFEEYWESKLVKHGVYTAYNVDNIVLVED